MRNAEKRTIDGNKYEFFQLPPKQSMRVLTKLLKVAIAPLGKAMGSVKGGKSEVDSILDRDIDFDALSTALSELSNRLDEDQVIEIFTSLMEYSHCLDGGGSATNLSWEHPNFQGRVLHLIKVMKASVEVNYSDFFKGASDALGFAARRNTTQES